MSSHGEVSSTHATVFSLSDYITPSGRREAGTMCGGNGLFFDWPSHSTFRSNCNCQSSLASNSGIATVESAVSNLLPFADTNELFATFGFRLDLNTAAPRFLINRKCWYKASNIESCLQVCLPWPSGVWQPHKMCLSVSFACEHRWQVASVILFQHLSTLGVGSTSSVAARLKRNRSSSPDMIQYVH